MKLRSKIPLLFYCWLLICIACGVALFMNDINPFYSIFIVAAIGIITYVVLAQFTCTFLWDEDSVTFYYIFPFKRKLIFNLEDVQSVQFELSYFFYLAEDYHTATTGWYHPYDTIYLQFKNETAPRIVKFNSSYFATLKLYGHLKKRFHVPFWEENQKIIS